MNPHADARLIAGKLIDAMKQVEALLEPFDDTAKTLLRPLLLNPLRIGAAPLPPAMAIPRAPAVPKPTLPGRAL